MQHSLGFFDQTLTISLFKYVTLPDFIYLISDDGIKVKANSSNIKDIAIITTTDTDTNRSKVNDSREMQSLEIQDEPIQEKKRKKFIDVFCVIRVVSIILLLSAFVGIILWNTGLL